MERRKLTKEDIDKVRDIEGFPIGSDEDIIALSDAPYYTACPNPFIEEFIREYGTPYDEETDDYHCEPFASDVSEGKTDPIYMAHAYHTKVPYKAIMRYILHYTKPGDLVFDGFAGTGMTGVAAQMCGMLSEIEKNEFNVHNASIEFGERYALLSDISPIATFIADNYNSEVNNDSFRKSVNINLEKLERECGWMYKTNHTENQLCIDGESKGIINYTIWSDVFICPNCGEEIVFWDAAIEGNNGKVKDVFLCASCGMELKKNDCQHSLEVQYDDIINTSIKMYKQVPVQINYTYNGKRYIKRPDQYDYDLISQIQKMPITNWVPISKMPEGSESGRNSKSGIQYVHQFYTRRNLITLAAFFDLVKNDKRQKFLFTSILQRASKLFKWSKNQAGPLSGTLYISSCVYETSIFSLLNNKKRIFDGWKIKKENKCINCASSTDLRNIPKDSVDYIFTDPPFGDNLMYSELSYIWESWLGVRTETNEEAIVNKYQNKALLDYQELMTRCFSEYYRILKPGRWVTVEFHNSKNAVWRAIQESLNRAGFIVADVRTLDKKQGSFKQVNNNASVKQDLVISAYKPKHAFESKIISFSGHVDTAWLFVRQHLSQLPIYVDADNNGKIDVLVERQAFLLFDRMVAYHIMQGIPVPMDAAEFYAGLNEHFIERDSMYFLPDQVNEYDVARIKMDVEDVQMELFVTNEKSAIAWLYKQLEEPQTYADLQPKFMQEAKTIDKHEIIPELAVLLEENFIQNDEGKWYIPDVTKEADVNKLREKRLWKEFEGYLNSKGKLKLFRSEAIRVGFSKLWKEQNYKAIVEVAERLPEKIVQEDPNILMYYDISLSRI